MKKNILKFFCLIMTLVFIAPNNVVLANSRIGVNNSHIYVTGQFQDTTDFDATTGVDEHTPVGSYDAYLIKYALLTYGCTDSTAENYDLEADRDDASCTFSSNSGNSGTSVKKRVAKLIDEGDVEAAEAIIERHNTIFSSSTIPIILNAFQAQLQQLLKQFKDLTGKEFGLVSAIPLRDLDLDMEGTDVTALQNLLINQGYTIPAGPTGYFGTQTQSALANYQKDHKITPATGYFGPITQNYLKQSNIPGVWW